MLQPVTGLCCQAPLCAHLLLWLWHLLSCSLLPGATSPALLPVPWAILSAWARSCVWTQVCSTTVAPGLLWISNKHNKQLLFLLKVQQPGGPGSAGLSASLCLSLCLVGFPALTLHPYSARAKAGLCFTVWGRSYVLITASVQRPAEGWGVCLQGLVIDWDEDATGIMPGGRSGEWSKEEAEKGNLGYGFPWSSQSETGINCLILMLIFLSVLSSGDFW